MLRVELRWTDGEISGRAGSGMHVQSLRTIRNRGDDVNPFAPFRVALK